MASTVDPSSSFELGQRVRIDGDPGLAGTVRFVGDVDFTEGRLVGVELDEPRGACDGTYEERSYFRCDPGRGVFVRPAVLSSDSDAGTGGAEALGANSWRTAEVQRQLALALEESEYRKILEQLIPEALSLGLSSTELQSFARLARAGLERVGREDFAKELEDLSPTRRAQADQATSFTGEVVISHVLQQRYQAVQDAMAELTATMAGLRSVVLPGSSPDTANIGKPARVISPLDRPLVGTWSYGGDNDANSGRFTITAQVGERGESLLSFEETLQDGRSLSSWLSRRDGDWLVGDLCNAYSKEFLGALKVQLRAETGKVQVAMKYRMAGLAEWGPEVLADFVSSDVSGPSSRHQHPHLSADPPSSRSSRVDGSEASKHPDVHAVPAGNPPQHTPEKHDKNGHGLGLMRVGSRRGSNATARVSHGSGATAGRNTFFGRLTGKHEATGETDHTDAILEAIQHLQDTLQESLRDVPTPSVDLTPIVQEIRAGTTNVLEGLKDFEIAEKGDIQGLMKEFPKLTEEIRSHHRSSSGSDVSEALRVELPRVLSEEIKLSTANVLEGIQSQTLATKAELEVLTSQLPSISEALAQVRRSVEVELLVMVKDLAQNGSTAAAATISPSVPASNGGDVLTMEVLQALRTDIQVLVKTQDPINEIRQVLLDGAVNVDFTEIKSTIHEYITVMQNTVKNGANMGPVLDTMRKNQKALVKKIEDGGKTKK